MIYPFSSMTKIKTWDLTKNQIVAKEEVGYVIPKEYVKSFRT